MVSHPAASSPKPPGPPVLRTRRLSELHPLLYTLAVWTKRTVRHLEGYLGDEHWCSQYDATPLPFRAKRHSSRLLKQLGRSEMWLQHNKVRNLAIAIPRLTDVLLLPGETFSFCRLVGRPTRRKGYVEGMELSRGQVRPGVGGGLCQLSNMIHWLALHSPLTVVERSNHSFDPFPDQNRSIPFGTGAAIFYNYIDLRLRNDTPLTFQFRFWLTDQELWGELRSNAELEHTYSVFERNHRFEQHGTDWYRHNEIWRRIMLRRGGATLREEFIKENRARVLYTPPRPNEPEHPSSTS
ncbi:VanW protein [Stigmatella aurantiaca DW4/3-1]|uniref:VanW protein n=1 Tax=Stigmatella aurantiaca (strain DW4/3-1) TaxID=378806 RepID=E3FEC6_STIAD|nr:VanW protein [Stigmatella aurantiaca DW4/3-1]